MYVRNCTKMTELIGAGEQEDFTGGIVFPELNDLSLVDLPCLTSFWCCHSEEAKTYKVGFPNLVRLQLRRCEVIDLEGIEFTYQLKHLNYCNNLKLPSTWQLRLHNMKELALKCYPWCHELEFWCFTKLEMLTVEEGECSTLFKVSDFRSLRQLQQLFIRDCPLFEVIVDDVWGGEAASGMDNNTITLFQLEYIFLLNLPNLKSFSSTANCSFYIPKLNSFSLRRCPRLESFTSLKTSTGLVTVHSGWGKKEHILDLNDYIRRKRISGARKSSCSDQDQETDIESVEEEKSLEELFEKEQLQYERVEEEGSAEERAQKEQPLEANLFSFRWSCPRAY